MKRRKALQVLGAMGIGAVLPGTRVVAPAGAAGVVPRGQAPAGTCWITPSETEGPYYFNANLVRRDIRTDFDTGQFHDGVPLTMALTVINLGCTPMPDLIVDVWHCDKDGVYSGYVQPGHNTVGQDFMRGIQVTNASGQCEFLTSYPGWYAGRATHVHFKVRLNASTFLTSQWCFPNAINDTIYQTPLYIGRGPNPTQNGEDGIFGSDNPLHEVMDVVPDPDTGGYRGTLTIGVNTPADAPELALDEGRLAIRSAAPNPFRTESTLSYFLPEPGRVSVIVYDMVGRRVATLVDREQSAGTHVVTLEAGDLVSGIYLAKVISRGQSDAREILLLR